MQIAILGAAGNLGQDIISGLSQLKRKDISLKLFDLDEQIGETVFYNEEELKIEDIDSFDFKGVDVIVLAIPESVVRSYNDKLLNSDAVVVDTSGELLSENNPLILASHNPEKIKGNRILVMPNPLVQQLVSVIDPLDKSVDIKSVVVSTYQSVSGRGKDAIAELYEQTLSLLRGEDHSQVEQFSTQIGFNCIPATSEFINESSKDELQLMTQSQILLGKQMQISATSVQVPTFIGYAQSVSIEFTGEMPVAKVKQILEHSEGVKVIDNPEEGMYATPYGSAETSYVYVSRIRNGYSSSNIVNLWIVSDNLQVSSLNVANVIKKIKEN